MTILRMRFTCWIAKATDTNSEYITLFAFPTRQCSHERASILRLYIHYVYIYINRPVKNYREQRVASKAHKAYFPTRFILKISSSADVLAGYY
jgi:hypothetical protein